MSGEDDRGRSKPEKNPFFDDADMLPRAKRVKPPPGIISAGGVDMARAHASGIKLRDAAAPKPTTDEPRVVVAVETDPRKVPTHKRLLDGREPGEDGTRSAMLPGGTLRATALATPASGSVIARGARPPAPRSEPPVEPAPAPPLKERKLPLALRLALATLALVLLAGVAQRYRDFVADAALATSAPADPAVITPPSPRVREAALGALVGAPRVAVPPVSSEAAPAAAPASSASSGAAPASSAEVLRRAVKAPPPRAAFTPPFQLPGEKN